MVTSSAPFTRESVNNNKHEHDKATGPYPQLRHKIKMLVIGGGICTEIPWRSYRFAMNDIKKPKNISGEAYIQSSNANARVLLFFGWFLLFLAN